MCQSFRMESRSTPVFAIKSYLVSEEAEVAFLRRICEVMIIFLLPRGYSLPPLKNLLSEILSYKSKKKKLCIRTQFGLILNVFTFSSSPNDKNDHIPRLH